MWFMDAMDDEYSDLESFLSYNSTDDDDDYALELEEGESTESLGTDDAESVDALSAEGTQEQDDNRNDITDTESVTEDDPENDAESVPMEVIPPSTLAAAPEPKAPSPKAAVNQSMDDDGQTCTICFDAWTNSSDHRLVSLRCGHLFGRSCITRWLKGQNRCPQCNARARKSEVRNIYAKTVKVLDTAERDKALADMRKECEQRRKAEMEAAQERLKFTMKSHECETLKRQLSEAHAMLSDYRLSADPKKITKKLSPFSMEYHIEIAKKGGCRVVDASDLLGLICVSQPSTNELFPGYGFRKISTYDMKPSDFILTHQKAIKDISFHSVDALVLTASLDKTVKISNVFTNSIAQTYNVGCDVWSCTWDRDDANYFYAGLRTGNVYLYDIRVTSRHVHELPHFGQKTPVVSLDYLKKTDSRRSCGPIIGKLSDCEFYQKLDQTGEYNVLPLPLIGPFTSVSCEPVSGNILVSARPSQAQKRVTHSVCELATRNSVEFELVQTVFGGWNQVQLTRSKLLQHPQNPTSLLICSGDDDAGGVLIWDGSSGKTLSHLQSSDPVLDMNKVGVREAKDMLFTLSDSHLRVYRWNNY